MTDESEDEDEVPKKIPTLSQAQKDIAYSAASVGSDVNETLIFNSGESAEALERQVAKREADRAEKFKDNFERVSIFGLYFLSFVFVMLTLAWGVHLVLPKKWQFLDDNQEDKLQLIITGGFVAGLASSHLKKRIGG